MTTFDPRGNQLPDSLDCARPRIVGGCELVALAVFDNFAVTTNMKEIAYHENCFMFCASPTAHDAFGCLQIGPSSNVDILAPADPKHHGQTLPDPIDRLSDFPQQGPPRQDDIIGFNRYLLIVRQRKHGKQLIAND